MKIIFEKIEYANIMSVGANALKIDLNRSPSTLITGENGAGKTTLIEAICFALYGKSFRGINKPQLINSVNKKKMLVKLWFKVGSVSYRVERGSKPEIFKIYKNGKLIKQDADVRDYQRKLENQIIGMSWKTFTQVIVLGTTTFVPFMQLTAAARREVVENLLDISLFTVMNQLLRGRVSAWTTEVSMVKSDMERIEDRIDVQKEYINKLRSKDSERKKQLKTKFLSLHENYEEKKKELELLQADNSSCPTFKELDGHSRKIESLLNEVTKNIVRTSRDIEEHKERIDFFNENDTCPVCEQDIDSHHALKLIERETHTVDSLVEEQNCEHTKEAKLKKAKSLLEAKYKKLRTYDAERRELESEIKSLARRMRDVKEESDTLVEDDVEEAKKRLEELEVQLADKREEYKELLTKKDVYENAQLLLKDSGVKAFIVKQYVPVINTLVNKYLKMLNFYVSFELDEEFRETIKTNNKDSYSYRSFSMGERQRIDLALLFTWRAVAKLKNSATTNLLFFDEVFDSSLDASGAEDLMTILDSLGKSTNAFVISHRGDQLADKLRSHIVFENVNGFTKIRQEKA